MAAFNYAVKTKKSIERGEDYYTVIAWGTKKLMLEYADRFDALPDTIASKITREKDGKVVQSYVRAIETDYLDAAARALYMRRLYMQDGSPKMMKRAETSGGKVREHTQKAAEIMNVSYDEAFEMVSNIYRKKFL